VCLVKDFFSNSTHKFSSVQILFLEPEAIIGVTCILIAKKEVGPAMQLLSNTTPFLLPSHFVQQTQSGASIWYVELYICECKNCCLPHPYEQHVDLNSSLEILLV